MRGEASSSYTMLLMLLLFLLPLMTSGAPTTSGVCGHGCECSQQPGVANCSSLAQLPADLWSLRVQPSSPGLISFLEHHLHHYKRQLVELYLADNEAVGAHLPTLRGFQRLRLLDLSFCRVSDPGQVSALVKHNRRLATLQLRGNPLVTLQALTSDTLKDLDVSDCALTSVRADTFTHLPHLQSLNLAHNRVSNLAAKLPTGLISLDVSGNALTHISPKVVATVGRIDISGNPIHCTCSVLLQRNAMSRTYVLDGSGAICAEPDLLRGLHLVAARHLCENRGSRKWRQRRQADVLDLVDGSGNGEDDGIGEDDEWDNEASPSDYDDDDDYYDETEPLSPADNESEVPVMSPISPSSVSTSTSSSTSARPQDSSDDSTRSLKDDIYEPTVPPPVPAAVDAADPAVPMTEIPPESGPPLAETAEGSHDPSVSEADNVDDVTEHKEDNSPSIEGSPISEEGKAETDVNEVMGTGDEYDVGTGEGGSDDEDYDYDLPDESEDSSPSSETSSDKIAVSPDIIPVVAEEEDETLSKPNSTATDSPPLLHEDATDEDYEESRADGEESINEVESPAISSSDKAVEQNETMTKAPETSHIHFGTDSVSSTHDEETPKEKEGSVIDENTEELEGSGENDNEENIPVGPLTGFLHPNSEDSATTTTEAPDDGTLLIDDELGEENDSYSPLIPPGAEESSEKVHTNDMQTDRPDVFIVASNNTEKEVGGDVDDAEDTEEGSGVPIIFGGEDWEMGEANETDQITPEPIPVHEEDLIVHRIIPVESGREISSSSEPSITTSTSEQPGIAVHGGVFRFNAKEEESESSTVSLVHTEPPILVGVGGPSSSSVAPEDEVKASDVMTEGEHQEEVVEEPIGTAAPVPEVQAVPAVVTSQSPLPEAPPAVTTELPLPPLVVDTESDVVPGEVPAESDDESENSEVETVPPTGDVPTNDTARVVVAAGEKTTEETPLNSAGSYVVLGIIMALVVFLLGYAVVRSRRGRQRAAAKAGGKDAEAAGCQQEGRELKEISKPLLTPAPASNANGKSEHLQPLVTKPSDNPDLKDDDADEIPNEKPLLEPTPKIHVYETLNGGEKERVPVHPPSPKKSPSGEADAEVPPVPEKRRALSRLPESAVDGAPNMYGSEGLPGEVLRAPPTVNGTATSPANGLSTFAPPVSPSSGRVKVVAREDPDSVPKKPVFVVNQGPGAASGVV